MESKESVVAVMPSSTAQTDAEIEMSKGISVVEEQAKGIVIETQEDYAQAAEMGKLIKQKAAEITDFFAPMKKAAHDTHKNICDREKAMLAPLVVAEKTVKAAMSAYIMEQERKRQEEEERLKRLAQEESERKLKEAIDLDEKGDKEAAEAALFEADIIEGAGRSVVVEQEKVKTESASSSFDFEIVAIDDKKVPVNIAGICVRPVDEKAIMRLIRFYKGGIQIPGVQFKKIARIAIRK